ncbi:MAG TPA: PEP-CTERM sorting domain-containing protein [Myxococcota bacterium]
MSATFAGNSSTIGYNLSNSAFMITFDETSGVNLNDTGYVIAQIDFTPDANVDYSLDGAYGALDAVAGYDALSVSLVDLTDSVALFVNSQVSIGTPFESLTLGQVGGDWSNSLSGSLSGSLIAGHNYRFNAQSQKANLGASAGASASGFVNLTFIPESGTGLLVMTGLLGLAYRQRRHGRAVNRARR